MSFALVAALATFVASARADTVQPTLYVAYTLNCTFTISDDAGRAVSSIAPGAYQIAVQTPRDFASSYSMSANDFTACKGFVQFSLTGPGVDLHTTLDDGNGTFALFTATLKPSSTYTAVDDNQPAVARAVFSTLASGSPTAPAAPASPSSAKGKDTTTGRAGLGSTAAVFRGSLDGIVSASGKLSLSRNGQAVGALKSGRWTIAVADQSNRAGFSIQLLHGKAQTITSRAFVGSHRVTIALEPGLWFFFTAGGKKSTFLVLS